MILTGNGDDVAVGGVGNDQINFDQNPLNGDFEPWRTDDGDDVAAGAVAPVDAVAAAGSGHDHPVEGLVGQEQVGARAEGDLCAVAPARHRAGVGHARQPKLAPARAQPQGRGRRFACRRCQ